MNFKLYDIVHWTNPENGQTLKFQVCDISMLTNFVSLMLLDEPISSVCATNIPGINEFTDIHQTRMVADTLDGFRTEYGERPQSNVLILEDCVLAQIQ